MICHSKKIIFIHIPKCAGSSIEFYFGAKPFNWREPNYETLTGWCPKRKIHLQHATAKNLLELDLIPERIWKTYFKFAFVRNPYGRAYSDYYWMMRTTKINDSFTNYINKSGKFRDVLNDNTKMPYRGDHLETQKSYLTINQDIAIDYVGYLENFTADFKKIKEKCGLVSPMNFHAKKSIKRHKHYSHFYNLRRKKLVEEIYQPDLNEWHYSFEDKRSFLQKVFNFGAT